MGGAKQESRSSEGYNYNTINNTIAGDGNKVVNSVILLCRVISRAGIMSWDEVG